MQSPGRKESSSSKKDASSPRKRDAIERLLAKPPVLAKSGLSQLRYLVLVEGLSADESGYCPYRPYVWTVLLRVQPSVASSYVGLVKRGPSKAYSKIRNDTFRTMATDEKFRSKVPEAALIRLLNSYSWASANGSESAYVQGMNVLAAPFLYACRSEAQAFTLFSTVIARDCPLYVTPALDGVHTGLKLLDRCLAVVDPPLASFLKERLLPAELYAFASVLTFSACTPPLSEVLVLWDFLFAYGVHMNILLVVAQLVRMRNRIMNADSPISVLRQFPALDARAIIRVAVAFVQQIPNSLYDQLARHPYDPRVSDELRS
uniref:ARAD1B14344p n=1 Tax=Blastobotrys adeninivorans TaxID=409370 RepID=A0A060T698_BLAAD